MIRVLLLALPIAFTICVSSGLAQISPSPANPQNPSSLSLQNGLDPSGGVGGIPAAPLSSPSVVQGIGTIPSSAKPGSLGTAGRGLPGMPGGPPIKGALGSQDPASTYMRPSVIGPLVCDPMIDGVCD